ncbi:MAG: hypothetical protein ACLFO1_09420 [Spirochaetaceae bacterium]
MDVKNCHGYLGSRLLRPRNDGDWNDGDWKYGGSFENRRRFNFEVYERIQKEINDPKIILVSAAGPSITLALSQPDRAIPRRRLPALHLSEGGAGQPEEGLGGHGFRLHRPARRDEQPAGGKAGEVNWCTACDNCIELLIRRINVGCTVYEKEYT